MTDRELYLAIRQAILGLLDAIERWGIGRGWLSGKTTAEIRKEAKKTK